MKYISTVIPDSMSVKGIYTVLRPNFSNASSSRGDSHDFPEILYIERGAHTVTIDGESYSLKSGQIIVYAPKAYHTSAGSSNAKASIISFEIDGDMLAALYNRIITLTPLQKEIFHNLMDVAINCFERRQPGGDVGGMLVRDEVDGYTLQKIKKQLEFFLIEIYKSCVTDAPRSTKARRWDDEFELATEYLKSHITDSLSQSEIAKGCSMSISKLKLLFRERTGSGPINYFINMKIEKAKLLIKEGELNFTQIADSLAFNSLHYFSRQFKKVTGVTPSVYAKSV